MPGLPADPETVPLFVNEMSLTKRPATVRRYVSSISHLHRAAGLPNLTAYNLVQLALRRMNRSQSPDWICVHRKQVDRLWARLEEWRAMATRYERAACSFMGVLCLKAATDWPGD